MPPKAKPDTAAYQKLKKDIKEGTIGTLYVFHGEEAYLRDFYLGQLKKKLLPAGMEEFNLHTLSGKEFDVKTLAQLVDCLPMMSERTLIVVNDYDIYKGDKDALAAVLRELPDYVCLVFVYDLIEYKADARTKLAALLKEKGSVVPFNRQGQGDLVDWISRRFKAMDHDIGTEDAKYLIFLCGDLMNNLISEIGKIGSYAAHHRVTRQDIDAVATPQLDAVVFQMTDAIAAGNFDKAAEVLGELLHMQEAPIKLLAVLGKQLRQLYTARLAIEHRKGVPYLMELWGMRSAYPAERLMQSARRSGAGAPGRGGAGVRPDGGRGRGAGSAGGEGGGLAVQRAAGPAGGVLRALAGERPPRRALHRISGLRLVRGLRLPGVGLTCCASGRPSWSRAVTTRTPSPRWWTR